MGMRLILWNHLYKTLLADGMEVNRARLISKKQEKQK
jgi:hypothetical protein